MSAGPSQSLRGPTSPAFFAVAAMLATMPIIVVQGPAHMTIMDAINFMVVAGYWILIFARRESIAFPLALPFWLIMIGSLGSLFAAVDRVRALLTISQDVYLYLWFVTVTDLIARTCRVRSVVRVWIGVACMVAALTFLDRHFHVLGGRFAGTSRAVGTFANPNMFGNYLAMSFFLTWAAAAAGWRYLYLALVPIGVGVLETASNGSLMGLMSGCAIAIATDPRLREPRRLGALIAIAAIAIAIVGVWRHDIEDQLTEVMSGKRGEIGGAAMKGAEERLPLWIASAQAFTVHPTGVGPNNFDDAVGPILGDYHGAHNEYVGMLVERGPVGFAGWCLLLGSAWLALLRLRRGAAVGFRPLAIEPLYGALAALTLHGMVIELFHFRHFWLLLAVIFAALTQATAAQALAARDGRPAPARLRAAWERA
jgi:hypothetical protein